MSKCISKQLSKRCLSSAPFDVTMRWFMETFDDQDVVSLSEPLDSIDGRMMREIIHNTITSACPDLALAKYELISVHHPELALPVYTGAAMIGDYIMAYFYFPMLGKGMVSITSLGLTRICRITTRHAISSPTNLN